MNVISVSPHSGALIAHFSDGAGLILVDRVIEGFGMSKTQLAETAGIASESLFKSARNRSRKTQSRLREMLEIVGRVEDWAGGPRQAMSWYRHSPFPR